MTNGSSKGSTITSPSAAESLRHSASASSWLEPAMRSSAPHRRMASSLALGTRSETQTTARTPSLPEMQATACAWFPVE